MKEITVEQRNEAYAAGFLTDRILSNPYKDDTLASFFVDGWCAGQREYGPRSAFDLRMGWTSAAWSAMEKRKGTK